MNKRKLKEIENNIYNIDSNVIDSLKSHNSNNNNIESNVNDKLIEQLINSTLNIENVCDKKKLSRNCQDNPNCIHNLGQKTHILDDKQYVIDNLLRDRKYVDKLVNFDKFEASTVNTVGSNSITKNTPNSSTTSNPIDNNNNNNIDFNEKREGPIGLRNLGATCYFNSLIQVLFMNLEFRKLMIEYDSTKSKNRNEILYQLQRLFFKMQFYKSDYLDPSEFINTLSLPNHQQQDIQEFFILFIDLLESQYHKDTNIISKLFKGVNNFVTICTNCKFKQVNPSSFYELVLQTHKCENIKDSFKSYFEEEILKDIDCKNCEKKCDRRSYNELSYLPPYLNIQLIRYIFDKQSLSKTKLHDSYKFPLEFNIKDYINSDDNNGKNGKHSKIIDLDENNTSINNYRMIFTDELFNIMEKKRNNSLQTDILIYQFIQEILNHYSVNHYNGNDDESRFIVELLEKFKLKEIGGGDCFEKIKELLSQYGDSIVNDSMNESSDSVNGNSDDLLKIKYQCTSGIQIDGINDMEEDEYIYELRAILMHRGLYTSSGHYLTHIKDDNGIWWKFNDESVTELDVKYLGKEEYGSSKRTKKEIDEEVISSKSAYMVLYSKKNRKQPNANELRDFKNIPNQILDEIVALDSTYDKDVQLYFEQFKSILNDWKLRKEYYQDIEESLQVDDDNDENYYWISTDWLSNWIQFLNGDNPIDNSGLLCNDHQALDPHKLEKMKRISKSSWEFFHSNYKGGPQLDKHSVCKKCLFQIYSSSKNKMDTVKLKEFYLKLEAKEPKIDSDNENNSKNSNYYYISKDWFDLWKKKSNLIQNPISPTLDITCPHGNLTIEKSQKRVINKDTWDYFKLSYPSDIKVFQVSKDKECEQCIKEKDDKSVKTSQKKQLISQTKKDMKEFITLMKSTKSIDYYKSSEKYYVVPTEWYDHFYEFLDINSDIKKIEPVNNLDFICDDHSSLLINFEDLKLNDQIDDQDFILVNESIWSQIIKKFQNVGPTLLILNGKNSSNIPFCNDCWFKKNEQREKDKYTFTESSIFVHFIKENDNEKDSKYYKSPSSRVARGYRTEIYPVNSDFTVSQLKLLILVHLNIADYQQNLYINNGITLLSDPLTLESYKITPNQIIVLKETEDFNAIIEKFNDNNTETGFKGSIFSKSSNK